MSIVNGKGRFSTLPTAPSPLNRF